MDAGEYKGSKSLEIVHDKQVARDAKRGIDLINA